MQKTLKIEKRIFLGFVGLGAILAVFIIAVVMYAELEPWWRRVFVFIAAIGIFICTYLGSRIYIFIRQIDRALRRLYEGDFDIAITEKGSDELKDLIHLFNKVVAVLKSYDQLRAAYVSKQTKIIRTVLRNISEGLIIIDRINDIMVLNKQAQDMFTTTQDELSIQSVVKMAANYNFAQTLNTVFIEKTKQQIQMELHLPIARAKCQCDIKFFPVKDTMRDTEEISTVVMIIEPVKKIAEQNETSFANSAD
ncbi:MAG: hypothetical protein ABH952_04350 [Candidatus Omnitrophota bacterium]